MRGTHYSSIDPSGRTWTNDELSETSLGKDRAGGEAIYRRRAAARQRVCHGARSAGDGRPAHPYRSSRPVRSGTRAASSRLRRLCPGPRRWPDDGGALPSVRHLQRVRHHLSFEVAADDLAALALWANSANVVFFLSDGSVRAPNMAVLLSSDGESDPTATLPYQADAVARRERTRARLIGLEPQPPVSIPPAIGEAELALKPLPEILRRALALLYMAA